MSRKPGDAGDEGAVRVGEVLADLLKRLGLDREIAGQEALARWPGVVGERIAAVTRPRGIARGTMFVEVRSSAWISELNLMRRDILARLNAGRDAGRIDKLVFILGAPSPDDPSG